MADKRKADEVAVPANIRGAQEDAARRTPPYPGDGTNTGETTPQAGPESGVTAVQAESNPDVPFDAHAREALDPDLNADQTADANVKGRKQ